jgi:hypothetical protein
MAQNVPVKTTTEQARATSPMIWFFVLALLVLGPLLGPGYLLLLDAPAGPHASWQSLVPVSSDGLVTSAAFALNVMRAVGEIHPQLPNKLVIALTVVMGGIGLFRFLHHRVRLGSWPALVAGTFFVINPFVYERMLAGQILLTASYAALPWALSCFARVAEGGERIDVFKAVAWVAAIGLIDIHGGAMALLLVVVAVLFSPAAPGEKVMFVVAVAGGFILVNFYWIVPSLLGAEGGRLGSGDYIAYAPRPRSSSILPYVFMLHGFWRIEFVTPLQADKSLYLLTFLPLAGAAFAGVMHATSTPRWGRAANALLVSCLVAAFLGMGRSFPVTEPLARFMFERVPGYGIFREPQKWVALVALGYAVFAGVGLELVAGRLGRWRAAAAHVVGVAVVLPLIATRLMIWGFDGTIANSHFPTDWERVDEITATEPGSILALPWNLYQPIGFAGERTIANPMPHYFRSDVVVSKEARLFVADETRPSDPRDTYVQTIMNQRRNVEDLGHLLAPLGIRFIALAHVADWSTYGFLERQDDLEPVFAGDEMTLYENTAWVGDSYGMEDGGDLDRLREAIKDQNVRTGSTAELHVLEPERRAEELPGASLVKALPGRDEIEDFGTPVTGTSRSCLDGWRLEGRSSVCHLGAFAAFEGPGGGELWRSGLFVQIVALVVSVAAVGGLVVLIRRSREERRSQGQRAEEAKEDGTDGRGARFPERPTKGAKKEGPQDGMGAFDSNL